MAAHKFPMSTVSFDLTTSGGPNDRGPITGAEGHVRRYLIQGRRLEVWPILSKGATDMQGDPLASKRTRDTKDFYERVDPLSIVDHSLLQFVARNAGHRILDLGCGAGGYAALLQRQGFDVIALDVNERYVDRARALGVDAKTFDGETIPLPDESIDSVMMIEVLEHIVDPGNLLREVARIARVGLIASVPNCTQTFSPAPVVYEHMLDVDHKNFFTVDSLSSLLSRTFSQVQVRQVVPVDAMLATAILPRSLLFLYRRAEKLRLLRQNHYFRLLATAASPK
jgi:SAM-dependent methyltransferase